jgi:hypothetical protein
MSRIAEGLRLKSMRSLNLLKTSASWSAARLTHRNLTSNPATLATSKIDYLTSTFAEDDPCRLGVANDFDHASVQTLPAAEGRNGMLVAGYFPEG